METRTYADAADFLQQTQVTLEEHEAANSLMLGICLRLSKHPEQITPPCLKTVTDENGLVLAAMMTPPYKLVIAYHQGDLEAAVRALAADLFHEEWEVPGVLGPRRAARSFVRHWQVLAGGGSELERQHYVYELRQVKSPAPANGRLRLATRADGELVAAWRTAFYTGIKGEIDREESRQAAAAAIEQGDIYLWQEERPVSMAMKTRPMRNGISVTLVYTPPELRGRGYASACVAALSRLLLASGWEFCALFAETTNGAANRVYQRIGYRPVADYEEYRFTAVS